MTFEFRPICSASNVYIITERSALSLRRLPFWARQKEKRGKSSAEKKTFFSLYLNKLCPQCNRQLVTTLMSPRELQCTFDQRVCRSCSATSTELATFCVGFHGKEKCLFIAKNNTSVVFRIWIPLRRNPDPSTRLVRLHGAADEKSAAACFTGNIV